MYEHVLDVVFSPGPPIISADSIAASLSSEEQDAVRSFLKPLILEIKNHLSSFPVTKVTLSNAPFNVMPVLRHILEKYESLIAANPQPAPDLQLGSSLQEQPDQRRQVNRRKIKGRQQQEQKGFSATSSFLVCFRTLACIGDLSRPTAKI